MGKPKPDVSFLWEKYSLDPFTGRFHCRTTDYPYKGNRCGGCHQLSISGEHRYPYGVCVFAWMNGRWPHSGHHIDHINFNPFDQRPWNIRELSAEENLRRRGEKRKRNHRQMPGPVSGLLAKRSDSTFTGAGRWRSEYAADKAVSSTFHTLHEMQKAHHGKPRERKSAIQVVTTISTEIVPWWL